MSFPVEMYISPAMLVGKAAACYQRRASIMDAPPSHHTTLLRRFPETVWTVVAEAAGENEMAAREALEVICRDYWPPVYSFLRQAGRTRPDAQDLTQGFFKELVTGDMLRVVSRDRARLRTFLLGALKRFLSREARHAHATKRGGQAVVISLDAEAVEVQLLRELRSDETPETLYERTWAMEIVTRARLALEEDVLTTRS